jgi:Protein of unknown function (DUF664)
MPPDLRITPLPGYTPTIGRLVGILTYARQTLVDAVAGLSRERLDHLHDSQSNSIGALLAHAAAVERWYQILTFEDREPSNVELTPWIAALDLGSTNSRLPWTKYGCWLIGAQNAGSPTPAAAQGQTAAAAENELRSLDAQLRRNTHRHLGRRAAPERIRQVVPERLRRRAGQERTRGVRRRVAGLTLAAVARRLV